MQIELSEHSSMPQHSEPSAQCPHLGGQEPQSLGQLEHVSPPLHTPSPQRGPQLKSAAVGCGQAALQVKYKPAHVVLRAQAG